MLDLSKIYNSAKYGDFKVLNYVNAYSVEIQFLDTGYKTTARAGNIRSGNVKDKLMPNVYGVGFVGDGEHKPRVNGKNSKPYKTWCGMLERCYSDKYQAKYPTYIGCSVDPIWHNFQNFTKWFDENYIEGYHLDKDCKIEGNKIYSPENCLFVSAKENVVKAVAKYYVFTSPEGETVHVYNLAEFCRENELKKSSMGKVANGKYKYHKQWTCSYE